MSEDPSAPKPFALEYASAPEDHQSVSNFNLLLWLGKLPDLIAAFILCAIAATLLGGSVITLFEHFGTPLSVSSRRNILFAALVATIVGASVLNRNRKIKLIKRTAAGDLVLLAFNPANHADVDELNQTVNVLAAEYFSATGRYPMMLSRRRWSKPRVFDPKYRKIHELIIVLDAAATVDASSIGKAIEQPNL